MTAAGGDGGGAGLGIFEIPWQKGEEHFSAGQTQHTVSEGG